MLRARRLLGARLLSSSETISWAKTLNKPLSETDPDLFAIIEKEKERQRDSLVLIASENFTSKSVFDALGSVMSNKYSEGYPGARYYGGNDNIVRYPLYMCIVCFRCNWARVVGQSGVAMSEARTRGVQS